MKNDSFGRHYDVNEFYLEDEIYIPKKNIGKIKKKRNKSKVRKMKD